MWVAKVRRRENGIKENVEVIMPADGMLLTGHLLIAVIMSVLILDQIGLTHILQLYWMMPNQRRGGVSGYENL